LRTVASQLAVISSGKNNLYKHPHSEVITRLEENKIPVWRTDIKGGVSVEFLKDKLRVLEF
jgi:competence protein ComEC